MSDRPTLQAQLEEHDAQALDLRFTDLGGRWRHLTLDAATATDERLSRAAMIDGASIPGWRDVAESDLLLLPDLDRVWADPFTAQPTLLCVADVADPATTAGYERCPRSALARVRDDLIGRGVADQVEVSVDLAFYVFDALDLRQGPTALGYDATVAQAVAAPQPWTSTYLVGQPEDRLADLRAEMVSTLARLGVDGLSHVALHGPGQCELKFGPSELLQAADQLQLARYVIDGVARAYGKVASFLPVPLAQAPGSGLHLHLSFRKDQRYLFAGQGYADLSDTCLHAIGGVLRHCAVLNAFANPSTNSYRRLRAGRAEPAILGFGARNRATAIRIPSAAKPEHKRVELRFPDPLANPYLTLGSLVLAMADGIQHRIDPGEPIDRHMYDLIADGGDGLERCAANLEAALTALDAARCGLFAKDLIPGELIDAYIWLKRAEIDRVAGQPHPIEHLIYGS
ncbi:MAG: glutamine synthetase [Geminicoccaceae bacterium]|nr:MAG: glutamine synthetase [Geminicoccaceae bacterium]